MSPTLGKSGMLSVGTRHMLSEVGLALFIFLPLPSPKSTIQCLCAKGTYRIDPQTVYETCIPVLFPVQDFGDRLQSSQDLGLFKCLLLRVGKVIAQSTIAVTQSQIHTHRNVCTHTHTHTPTDIYTYSHMCTQRHRHMHTLV